MIITSSVINYCDQRFDHQTSKIQHEDYAFKSMSNQLFRKNNPQAGKVILH